MSSNYNMVINHSKNEIIVDLTNCPEALHVHYLYQQLICIMQWLLPDQHLSSFTGFWQKRNCTIIQRERRSSDSECTFDWTSDISSRLFNRGWSHHAHGEAWNWHRCLYSGSHQQHLSKELCYRFFGSSSYTDYFRDSACSWISKGKNKQKHS